MDVVLQGIDMPKTCFDCPCHDGEYGRCNITKSSIGLYDTERPHDCPLKKAEPAVVHACWVQVYDKYPRYVCTNCNHLYNNKGYKHCPFCGARMDKKGGKKK